jgi:hypothetical protein
VREPTTRTSTADVDGRPTDEAPNVFWRSFSGRTQWMVEAAIIVVSLAVAYFAATL